jgi:uncharacterized membrane protein YuzA (DUF378 family)
MALIGVLSYDIVSKKFKIEPQIMGMSLNDIISYYDMEYIINTLPRFVFFIMGMAGAYLIYKPFTERMKRLYHKFIDRFFRRGANARQK